MLILSRTIRYRTTGKIFFRRLHRMATLEFVELDGFTFYLAKAANGSRAYIPVHGTTLHTGKKIIHLVKNHAEQTPN